MPSASTKVRWNWRCREDTAGPCRPAAPANDELALLDRDVELVAGEARDRQGDPQTLGLAVLSGDPSML